MMKKLARMLSPKFYLKLMNLYCKIFGKDYLVIYSQEGEDIILQRIFSNKNDGFYVDVGAHHPKRLSNTYLLYRQGWSGINVDAMPGSMKDFKKVRPRDTNIEAAVSDEEKTLTYYMFNSPALNGFSKEISRNREKDGIRILCTKEIKTIRLDTLLAKYISSDKEIDFMSIDVEGLDLSVLKSNNWKKYRPKVILVEALGSNVEQVIESDLYYFVKKLNYRLFSKLYNTLIFIDNETDI